MGVRVPYAEQEGLDMRAARLRAIVPILLLLAGAGSIAIGVKFHATAVLAQVEQKAPVTEQPSWFRHGSAGGDAKQYVATWLQEAESQLIKEVTVGGVTLVEGGEVHRTYKGLDMPSLCPT
jgi:hypothetical protein